MRSICVTTPTEARLVLTSVPRTITAGDLSRVLSFAQLPGCATRVRIVDGTGRLLAPGDRIATDSVVLVCEPDRLRGARVATALLFWALHLLPLCLWLSGAPARLCFYAYFLSVAVLILVARRAPIVAVRFAWPFTRRRLVRALQLLLALLSPTFNAREWNLLNDVAAP
jgi:hypothetical protein